MLARPKCFPQGKVGACVCEAGRGKVGGWKDFVGMLRLSRSVKYWKGRGRNVFSSPYFSFLILSKSVSTLQEAVGSPQGLLWNGKDVCGCNDMKYVFAHNTPKPQTI